MNELLQQVIEAKRREWADVEGAPATEVEILVDLVEDVLRTVPLPARGEIVRQVSASLEVDTHLAWLNGDGEDDKYEATVELLEARLGLAD